jgi:hypothetical protein
LTLRIAGDHPDFVAHIAESALDQLYSVGGDNRRRRRFDAAEDFIHNDGMCQVIECR